MFVETRKTAAGTEYWDSDEKRVLFVRAGDVPLFEVTANPPSMLMGVDWANGKDASTIDGVIVETSKMIEDMTIKELRAFADELEIEIPDDVKKKTDIIALLTGNETK